MTNLFGKATIIIFTLLSINGCVSIKIVEDSTKLIERNSYSVLPPQGAGWKYFENSERIEFGNVGPSATHSIVAAVAETPIPDNLNIENEEVFLDLMKVKIKLDHDPKRFDYIEEDLTPDIKFSPYCVRYYGRIEDRYAAQRFKVNSVIMELYQYHFIHPNNKNTLISISYSERGIPGENSSNFKDLAERFIDGLKLK